MTASTLALRPDVEWTPEQRDLIKRTVAPDATDDELAMFLHVARVSGLDPLQKQIWFMKRWQKRRDAEGEVLTDQRTGKVLWEQRVTIMAGADGLQARALRYPDCTGIRYAAVYDKDVFLVDRATGVVKKHLSNPFKSGQVIGAWACVEREGKAPFFVCVAFDEYRDKNGAVWKTKPITMIEKVARATACRRAYPEAFAGIYDEAELEEGEGRPELDATPAPAEVAAAPSNVSRLPPPESRAPAAEPATEPRVELDPAEVRARSLGLAASAERAQREQEGREARDIETRAKAIAKGVDAEGYRLWCEKVLGRQLPNERGWNRHLTEADRDDLAAAVEQLPAKPPAPKPAKAAGKRGAAPAAPTPVANGDGSHVPTPA